MSEGWRDDMQYKPCLRVELKTQHFCLVRVQMWADLQISISKSPLFKLQIPILNPTKANKIKSAKLRSQIKSQILFYSAHKIHQMKKADIASFTSSEYYTDYCLQVMVISSSLSQQQWLHCCCRQTAVSRVYDGTITAILNSCSTDEDVARILG